MQNWFIERGFVEALGQCKTRLKFKFVSGVFREKELVFYYCFNATISLLKSQISQIISTMLVGSTISILSAIFIKSIVVGHHFSKLGRWVPSMITIIYSMKTVQSIVISLTTNMAWCLHRRGKTLLCGILLERTLMRRSTAYILLSYKVLRFWMRVPFGKIVLIRWKVVITRLLWTIFKVASCRCHHSKILLFHGFDFQ